MEIPESLKLNELKGLPVFSEVAEYIRFFPGAAGSIAGEMRLKDAKRVGWNTQSLLYGLNRLEEVCSAGSCLHRIYSPVFSDEPRIRRDVNLIFFPRTADKGEKPFIILCPGGAFISVGSISEGFPIAAEFNSCGYDVFILTYSVGLSASMPKPIEDLAAAISYVLKNRSILGVSERYIVGGFSAGGFLAALWGTDNHGFASFGLPAPEALFPIYAIIDPGLKCRDPLYLLCNDIMFSRKHGSAVYEDFNVCLHMAEEYPPCFIACGSNDVTVPPENSRLLKNALDKMGIPASLEMHENAPHGFGDGRGTDAYGWIGRACSFFESAASVGGMK